MEKKDYQSPVVGQEISCIMKNIDVSFFDDNQKLKQLVIETLNNSKFGILNSVEHEFSPQGFTMMALLSESHFALHTYPEHNAVYFSIYSCRGPKDSEPVFKELKEKLKPKEILFLNDNEIPLV